MLHKGQEQRHDRLNFVRLQGLRGFHPIRAIRAVRIATENCSDQNGAPHELSNAYGAELLLPRVRRLAYAMLQIVLPVLGRVDAGLFHQ